MPSIRLRANSAYSTLHDPPVSKRPALATVFTPHVEPLAPAASSNGPAPPRTQRSLPTLRTQSPLLDVPPPLPTGRFRSGTTTSRIQSYISSSRRHSRPAGTDNDSRSSLVPIASPTTIEIDSEAQSSAIRSVLGLRNSEDDFTNLRIVNGSLGSDLHHDEVVEHLDVIDAEISAASNLTNAANSIIFPPLSWYSRKPVLFLPAAPPSTRGSGGEGQQEDFDDSLDRHVNDVLQRRFKFRRTIRGIWSFLKTPMGVITAIYGFLVAFWGAAIVLFVAKIINLHNPDRQGFWVEVCSQIENGLFTITGIGLIPSRVLDTYRIYWIWYYKCKTRRLRAQAGWPQLLDEDDLPDPAYDPNYVHVLTENEEKNLHKQQHKFQHHQTWYRPHGTETHRAFPINTALMICLLVDGNSFFQIILCGTMWGLNRFQRPAWSTGTLIPCSFFCGIFAAVLIWRGGQKTKRVAEVEERLRAALAAENHIRIIDTEKEGNKSPPAQTIDQTEQLDNGELQVDEYMTIPRLTGQRRPSSKS